MDVRFTLSADRHGVAHECAVYAIAHAVGMQQDGEIYAFVGHPHAGALDDDWLEVLARKERSAVIIFHVMRLSDHYRYLLYKEGL